KNFIKLCISYFRFISLWCFFQEQSARQATLAVPLKIEVNNDDDQAFSPESTKRDKKPFTYFSGGKAPDLSGRPSPSIIRKTNTLTGGPQVPRTLPIVPDLQYSENPSPQQQPAKDMATLTHQQYNSPMALYSKENIQEVLQQSADGPRPFRADAGKYDLTHSQTYQLVHEQDQISPRHSARYEDSSGSEYPRYKGYVDANLQSPSFRRLQYMTGVESESDTEAKVVEHHPDFTGGSAVKHEVYEEEATRREAPAKASVYSHSAGGQAEEVSDYDHPLDAQFTQKILEAEKPKVPVEAPPVWARTAQAKHAKWQSSNEARGQQQEVVAQQSRPRSEVDRWQKSYQYEEYQPAAVEAKGSLQRASSQSRATETKPYQEKSRGYYSLRSSKDHWLKPYVAPNVTTFRSTGAGASKGKTVLGYSESTEAKKPLEFGTFYGPGEKTTYSSSTTTTVRKSETLPRTYGASQVAPVGYAPKKQVTISSLVSGEAEKPSYVTEEVPPWHKHAEYKRTVWEKKRTAIDPDQQQKPAIAGERPSWTQKAAEKQISWEVHGNHIDPRTHRPPPPEGTGPQWTKKAEKTHSIWQHEADAWLQKKQMEDELSNRGYSAQYSTKTTTRTSAPTTTPPSTPAAAGSVPAYHDDASPPWRQKKVPHERVSGSEDEVSRYHDLTTSISQTTAQTPRGETKSKTSGSYIDPEGHTVDYVKEAYTTVDPGKEFSMLTEEQRKVLEEPLEPGVISRHVTTKYYKKATYTSTSTTTTTQAPPIASQSSSSATSIGMNGPAGQMGVGVTQF
ncbi:unnamed protein product, partial [Soboliphyme baturini]|uniref:ZM domain-containing protein n=1 Tax=Soboliphyme baturini TaxID=241478 RepID=A0A183ILX0_9BILA